MAKNLIKGDTTIKSVKPGDGRKRLSDGDGLYLLLFVKGGSHGWRFDSFITAEAHSDRILGKSQTATVAPTALVMVSGNNLVLKGDLPRRLLKCRIDPGLEAPHQRGFAFDPVAVVSVHRHELVDAALTILKAAFVAMTEAGGARFGPGRMASFEAWDDLVRQAVCWLAGLQGKGSLPSGETAPDEKYPYLVDPMEAVNDAMRGDPALTQQGRLLAAWASEVGTGPSRGTTLTVRQLLNVRRPTNAAQAASGAAAPVAGVESLHDVLQELAGVPGGVINVRALGKLLPKYKDRICDGRRLRAGTPHQRALTWWVEELGECGDFGESVSDSTKEMSSKFSTPGDDSLTKPTKVTSIETARKGAGRGRRAA